MNCHLVLTFDRWNSNTGEIAFSYNAQGRSQNLKGAGVQTRKKDIIYT